MSLEAGKNWVKLMNGLPTVSVDDIHTQPRDLDLVVGTHGRSVYILDGVQVFEEWKPAVLRDTVTFFSPRTAWAWHSRSVGGYFGLDEFSAKNPPFGAWFDYYVPVEVKGGVSVTVEDSTGKTIRTLTGPGEAGFHRVVWDLVAGEPRQRIRRLEASGQSIMVKPGRYKVRMSTGSAAARTQPLEVRALPGTYHTDL
jgi:hypothetical protein